MGPERGTFWCAERVRDRLASVGIEGRQGKPRGLRRLVVVAGASDAWTVRPMPSALVEHGAGQAYDVPNAGWSGGPKRDGVVLFLCPNEPSAERNRATYPATPALVVGSPRVEALRSIGRSARHRGERNGAKASAESRSAGPTVAFSFHWPCPITPECGWALPHYEDSLGEVFARLRQEERATIIGHGHPRAAKHWRRLWRALGVEHVVQFADVVRRADLYACDNSSTLFEFAALDRPVVVLNSPAYRRDVDLWPRFWACADVGMQVDEPDQLAQCVRLALQDLPRIAERRRARVAEVYPLLDGQAAQRSAHALRRAAASLQ